MNWKKLFRWGRIALTLVAIAGGIGFMVWWMQGHKNHAIDGTATPEELAERTGPVSVNVIRPLHDKHFEIIVEQYASTEPFFLAPLRSRVAGTVLRVPHAVGDRVYQGELLVELDAPELVREVAQKHAIIDQRRQDLAVSKAKLADVLAGLDVSRKSIELRQVEVTRVGANLDLSKSRLERYQTLAARNAINGDLVDEQRRDVRASQSALDGARIDVERAKADLEARKAGIETARADVRLKDSSIVVAQEDLAHSEAVLSLTRVLAPFDGKILKRNVEPGMSVSSANSSTAGEPLLVFGSADLITVVARFPDHVAPFVARETEALIELNELPGVTIEGRVSRFAPAIENSDRTIRVEVDLYNGSVEQYRDRLERTIAGELALLGGVSAPGQAMIAVAGRSYTNRFRKGTDESFPLRAVPINSTSIARAIIPGMTGKVRLVITPSTDTYLIKSSAIFNKGGKPYLLVVRDGYTQQTPIEVHFNDYKLAKVSLVGRMVGPRGATREVLRDLTGDELIVVSRQQEIGDGTEVAPTVTDWAP